MCSLSFKTYKKNRLADGSYNVYLAVTHKSDCRVVNTQVNIPNQECLVNNKVVNVVNADVANARLHNVMNICQERLKTISVRNYSCLQLKEFLKKALYGVSVHKDVNLLSELFDYYISYLKKENRVSSAEMYMNTKNVVLSKMGDMSLVYIKQMNIKNLMLTMLNEGLSDGSVSMCLKQFKTMLRFASNEGLVIYEHFPFENIRIPQPQVRFRDLTEDDFIRLKNYPIAEMDLRFVRDMFLLSFYLGGMLIQDMVDKDFSGKVISYVSSRNANIKKYKNEISITIPPEARTIINRYSEGGKIVWPWKAARGDLNEFLRNRLKRLSKELELSVNMTITSPGKTFSHFGCMLGIEGDVLRHCTGLNVDLQSPIYNYVKVVNSLADGAIRKILDYVKDYEDNQNNPFNQYFKTAL